MRKVLILTGSLAPISLLVIDGLVINILAMRMWFRFRFRLG